MSVLWFAGFAVLLVGYFALEGVNIGMGLLLPVLGRDGRERGRLVARLGPLVLAGEVWLVAVGGVLFGVFPLLEGKLLTGLYPLVVTLLLAWVVRDAGLWFRRRAAAPAWRGLCDALVVAGSAVLAFVWGLVLSAVLGGLDGPLLTVPGALLGLLLAGLLALHGAAFAARRLANPVAAGLTSRLGPVAALPVTGLLAALPALTTLVALAPHLFDHTAPDATLAVLTWIALPFVPVMVAVQWWAWRLLVQQPRAASFF